jgi:hypothetical protein
MNKMFHGDFMKEKILEYINLNKKSLSILIICMLTGFAISIFIYQFLDTENKSELSNSITSILNLSKEDNFEGINVINNGLVSNGILILCIYVTCITLICPLLVSLFNFFKGFTIGIYVLTLFEIFGFKNGILTMFLVVILPNIIYIPAYLYISTNSINVSYNMQNGDSKYNVIYILVKEFYHLIISFSLVFLSLIVEQLLSGIMINIYKSMT